MQSGVSAAAPPLLCRFTIAPCTTHPPRPTKHPPCAPQASLDAQAAANRTLDSLAASMDDDGDAAGGGGDLQRDAADPQRFFQQRDSSREDMALFAGVLLLGYSLVRAWGQLFSGGGGGLGGF